MNNPLKALDRKRGKRLLIRAFFGSLLLALPACQIPMIHDAEQGANMPAGFNKMASTESEKEGSEKGAKNSDVHANTLENSSTIGFEEFFGDPLLTGLIQQGLVNNRELKILDQEVQIARNEVLARQGAYLPFVTIGGGGGIQKPSQFTPEGAVERQLEYLPGKHFPDPLPNTQVGLNLFWQLDIWRQLRNARDAAEQRYVSLSEKRNYFVTHLIAEIADNYYHLVALDQRLVNLDRTIDLQEKSLSLSKAKKEAGRGSELPVQRFLAEVRSNQSEKLIVKQEIIEVENKINFLVNRFPEPVERKNILPEDFFDLTIHQLSVGLPAQLLRNRPDIRQAERELQAAGLDVKVARANFFPTVTITGGVGFEAFNPMYFFTNPAQSIVAGVAGGLVAPLINKKAIQAEYLSANARQLEAVYNYQRTVLNAYTEVVNRMAMVENYSKSIEIKKQQLKSLETSVEVASKLFQAAKAEYIDVLLAQRDQMDARMAMIETKKQQLSAIVNAYQALGGGGDLIAIPIPEKHPHSHS